MPSVYALLLALRCVLLLTPSYIHPDEHFQSGEIAAPWVTSPPLAVSLPWEVIGPSPIRSLIPPFLVSGTPLKALLSLGPSSLTSHPPLWAMVLPQRLACLALSLVGDWAMARLPPIYPRGPRGWLAPHTLLSASAWPVLILSTRPLANGIEATLAALSLLYLARWARRRSISTEPFTLAALLALGTYLRPSFVGFAGGVAGLMAMRVRWKWKYIRRLTTLAVAVAAGVWTVCVVADSVLYKVLMTPRGSWRWVIPPLNFVAYNTVTDNVASHGLHPRITHLAVNGFLMFGPLWALAAVTAVRMPRPLGLWLIPGASFLALVSLIPHQEPRFLAPMLPVLVYACGEYLRRQCYTTRIRFLWVWGLFNVVGVVVFGVLHQGGVLPALDYISGTLDKDSVARVGAFHTYTVPRHLLGLSDAFGAAVSVQDLGGASVSQLAAWLASGEPGESTLLMAPSAALNATGAASLGLERVYTYWPHLSFEDMGGLSMHVWRQL